jgi:methionyl-tRNA formyltransferase
LQHTILSGTQKTGVTLQTLDDKSFDHGIILAQTPDPFLSVPNWEHCTYNELLDFVSPKAAGLLVQGLRDRVFIPPLRAVGLPTIQGDRNESLEYRMTRATKITPEDRKIDFLAWRGDRIYRHYRALGRLWTNVWIDPKTTKRLIFENITLIEKPILAWTENGEHRPSGASIERTDKEMNSVAPLYIVASKEANAWHPVMYVEDGNGVIFNTKDNAIRVGSITIEGQSRKAASNALRNLRPGSAWRFAQVGEEEGRPFVEPVDTDQSEYGQHHENEGGKDAQ